MTRTRRVRLHLVTIAVALVCATSGGGDARLSAGTTSLAKADAFVSGSVRDERWSVGAGGVSLNVGFAKDGALVIRGIGSEDGGALLEATPDASIALDGREVVLGDRRDEGVFFAGDRAEDYRGGVRLTLTFNVPEANARVLRRFVAYPGTPIIETWFELERLDGDTPVEASSIAALRVGVAGRNVAWHRGLEMNADPNLSFTLQERTLGEGDSVSFGSAGRATESNLPFVSIRTPGGTFFAGLLWSGGWRIDARGNEGGTDLTARLDDVHASVPPGGALEGVHGFMGVVPGGEGDVAAAMRAFLIDGLRGGRGFPSLVSYNTWFVHGVEIDDELVDREIELASELGAELFQLDAGWYEGTGREGAYDFTAGLGTWAVDRERFRDGLRGVGGRVRAAGMRFGLWVEPERTDLASVGAPGGPRQEWLAATGGQYRPGIANEDAGYAQICLAHPDAWQWAYDHLAKLVADDGVQYFVYDSNDWINCTREGHGHGERDGHFAHVRALYRLLAALRERFPELLIENCAGGGNRIDLGLAQYTDAGWMDDRTTPSSHVRQNLHGLSGMIPPSYLLSYAMPSPEEPMSALSDLPLVMRSRMGGVLGLSYRNDELREADFAVIEREIDIYKRARSLVQNGSAVLLTPQTTTHGARPSWELVQHVHPAGTSAVVFGVQNDGSVESVRVRPQRLAPQASFDVISIEGGRLGTFSGQRLMDDGFVLTGSPNTAANIVLLQPASAASALRKRP